MGDGPEQAARVRVEPGDCLETMARMIAVGVQMDSCVTDPPYHLTSIVKRFGGKNAAPNQQGTDGRFARATAGFMGQKWDGGDIAFRPETWRLCYDLLKPGAYLVAFSGTRTYHRTVCAIEDAGFIIHPMLGWIFGQGFPKAHNPKIEGMEGWRYGTQSLKPAFEPICMAQKPPDGKMRDNILKYGTGALNIDGCRIYSDTDEPMERQGEASQDLRYDDIGSVKIAAKPGRRYKVKRLKPGATLNKTGGNWRPEDGDGPDYEGELKAGRWPANIVTDGSDGVFASFPDSAGQLATTSTSKQPKTNAIYGAMTHDPEPHEPRGDSGSAARYFYAAKADKEDRFGSRHPTVKPIDLMRWLTRLVTPPEGLVLDPFAGSGTTGVACLAEGFRAILCEREEAYLADIRERLAYYEGDGRHSMSVKGRARVAPAGSLL